MPRYDNDYDDDRPRRRGPRKRKPKGVHPGVYIGAGVLALAAVVVGVVLLTRKPATPPAGGPDPAAPDATAGPGTTRPPAGGAGAPAPTNVRAVPLAVDPALVTGLVFAGGDEGHAATITFRQGGGGEGGTVDVFAAATGAARGKVEVALPVVNGYAVSPDGKWVAALTASATEGQSVVVYGVADGMKAGAFAPYPRRVGAPSGPGLGWLVFLPGDRLLTISDWGGADVWAVPGMTRVGGRAARGDRFRAVMNQFTKAPTTFAVTPDGKTLAVLDGTSFGLGEPTGGEAAPTAPYTPGRSGNEWAAALRPDGSKLAFFYSTHDAGAKADGLVVWDAKTGKAVAEHGLTDGNRTPAGCAWWGPDHLLTWAGTGGTAGVVDARTGKAAGQVKLPVHGKFVTAGGGDRLWALVPGAGPRTAALVRADPPAGLAPGVTFELTRDGLAAR